MDKRGPYIRNRVYILSVSTRFLLEPTRYRGIEKGSGLYTLLVGLGASDTY